jgi:nucleoside-diphosphate-sugar epimerase
MKILITGKNSYIGNSVKVWLKIKEHFFTVDEISLKDIDLKKISFKDYDVVFHVAGIAHISSNKKLISEYYRINRDLAIEVAKKAKEEGVRQFIFTSSMAIYGNDRPIGDFRPIDIYNPSPTNAYGKSKLDADLTIQKLQNESFNVSILRLPIVYGKLAKGNFPKLEDISKKFSIFPRVKNVRSVLQINNLSELVRLIIINKLNGVFFPQDKTYFNTNDFILNNRSSLGKKTLFVPFLSFPLKFFSLFFQPINKIYGNKYYQSNLSTISNYNYQLFSIDDYIKEINAI